MNHSVITQNYKLGNTLFKIFLLMDCVQLTTKDIAYYYNLLPKFYLKNTYLNQNNRKVYKDNTICIVFIVYETSKMVTSFIDQIFRKPYVTLFCNNESSAPGTPRRPANTLKTDLVRYKTREALQCGSSTWRNKAIVKSKSAMNYFLLV